MKIRLRFFLNEAILFSLTLVAGLFIAHRYGLAMPSGAAVEPIRFSWGNIAFIVAFFAAFSYIMARYRGVARVAFRIFLFLVVLSGAQLFFAAWLASPYDFAAGIAVAAGMFLWRNAFMHNLAMILGIGGISAILGLSLTPTPALAVLAAMSLYDIIAVYRTRTMVRLAQNMVSSGAIFGFLIPTDVAGFFAPAPAGQVGDRFMLLGSGDIGLPLMFAASMVTTSLTSAIIVAIFSLGGLFVTHLLFINQTERRPMAALPPIATASIIGYLVSLIF